VSDKKFSARRTWRRIRSEPGLARNVAVIVVFVVLGLVATGYMIGQSKSALPFQAQTTLKVEFSQVPGVTAESSQSVKISGVQVGQITDTEATDRDTAILTLKIDAGNPVYDNAHAVLRAVNPLNQMYVEIDPGGPPGHLLGDGALLPISHTSRPIQADEVLQPFDQKAQAALTDLLSQADVALAHAPQQLPDGLTATDQGLNDLRPAVQLLQTRREKIAQLVTSLGEIAQAAGGDQTRATRLADATEQTLGTLSRNDAQLRGTLAQLPGLSTDLRRALSGTQRLTGQLNPTLDDLNRVSEDLPDTLDQLTSTVKKAGDTVDAARPVVERARPVVSDLRPLVKDVNDGLDDLLPVTRALDKDTKLTVDYLTELEAFVYNTSSVFGVQDGRGGIIRGHAIAPLPDGSVLPGAPGYAPTPEEDGMPATTRPTLPISKRGH
jgi:phospholipid/cholesterol/gamma-HCH transport system substrate-binding protein